MAKARRLRLTLLILRRMGTRTVSKLRRLRVWRLAIGVFIGFSLTVILNLSGLLRHLSEKPFESEFSYPLESPHFRDIVEAFRLGEKISVAPINDLYNSLSINTELTDKCSDDDYFPIIILVKSAASNFKQRKAIRETWKGSAGTFNLKTVFFVGNPAIEDVEKKAKLDQVLREESNSFKDIVHLGFQDSYYNNTIKIMLEMRWAAELCPYFDFALLIDDDYFLSVKNLMKFTQNPMKYPSKEDVLEKTDILYAGYRMFSPPHRHKIFTKWFISLDEYPYDYFPPYITAGAILLSKKALIDIYYASFYTAHFRFDDIYVAICAKKMNITPLHSDYFRFWSTRDESPEEFLIASHGFSEPERLHRFWNIQKSHEYC